MSDSDGISRKAVMKNYTKATPPPYATEANIHVIESIARNKAQPRNERCVCGSGLKYKLCCGK